MLMAQRDSWHIDSDILILFMRYSRWRLWELVTLRDSEVADTSAK